MIAMPIPRSNPARPAAPIANRRRQSRLHNSPKATDSLAGSVTTSITLAGGATPMSAGTRISLREVYSFSRFASIRKSPFRWSRYYLSPNGYAGPQLDGRFHRAQSRFLARTVGNEENISGQHRHIWSLGCQDLVGIQRDLGAFGLARFFTQQRGVAW